MLQTHVPDVRQGRLLAEHVMSGRPVNLFGPCMNCDQEADVQVCEDCWDEVLQRRTEAQ